MRIIAVTAVTLFSALLLACGGADKETLAAIAAARLIYSPNGEPLTGGPLGHPSCEEALARWFDRLDVDRRGTIDRDQYLADARRQFTAMDLDKQGAITADQLSRYRAPYDSVSRSETAAGASESSSRAPRSGQGAHRPGQSNTGPRASAAGGPRGHSLDEEPDPVMAADVHLQFKVTLPDFVAYADGKFVELNGKHDGRLAKTEVLAQCQSNRNR
jgi:hypothetical protein